MRNQRLESRVRENRKHGSEGGKETSRPLSTESDADLKRSFLGAA